MSFQGVSSGKEPICQCSRHKRCGFASWVERSPGGGHRNPLQYSCLENPMGKVAWLTTVYRVKKESDTTEVTSEGTGGLWMNE